MKTLFNLPVPHRGLILSLIVVGGALQVAGVLTVVGELVRSRREARRLGEGVLRFSSGVPVPPDEKAAQVQVAQLIPMVRRMLEPNWPRLVGVGLVVIGIAATTVGAAMALYLSPDLAGSTQVIK